MICFLMNQVLYQNYLILLSPTKKVASVCTVSNFLFLVNNEFASKKKICVNQSIILVQSLICFQYMKIVFYKHSFLRN
jgi:hypothetical protein